MTIELFDTTLRDGTQGENVNLSIQDKLAITQKLDEFGIDYIEGGWPGSNPKDEEYFKNEQKHFKNEFKQVIAEFEEKPTGHISQLPTATPVILTLVLWFWPAGNETFLPDGRCFIYRRPIIVRAMLGTKSTSNLRKKLIIFLSLAGEEGKRGKRTLDPYF